MGIAPFGRFAGAITIPALAGRGCPTLVIVRASSRIAVASVVVLAGCGRTEPYWWSDIYASDTGDEVGSSESSGSESGTSDTGTSTSDTGTSTSDTSTSDTSTSDTTDTSTSDTTGACDPVLIELSVDPATVVFLLDQGNHMDQAFDGSTRWEAIGLALFEADTGVVPIWQAELRQGFTSFTSFNGNQGGECPVLVEFPPALLDADAMATAWSALQPEDENPSGEAIVATSASLAMDPTPGSKTIVLITGRNPDTCAQPNPQNGAGTALAATSAAFQAGVETRLVVVGNLNNGDAQALANVGVGLPAQGATAPFFKPATTLELRDDLDDLLTSLRPCSFGLAQSLVAGGEQLCSLTLAGQSLPLDDPDGWSVDAGTSASLQGAACTDYRALGPAALELMCECEALL